MTVESVYLELLDRGLHLRIDEDDRLIVGPSSLLVDADRANIRRHRDELAAMVAIDASQEDQDEERPAPRRIHSIPSTCLGPTACAVLGVCGRASCVSPEESAAFAVAMATARRPDNPHGVPDFYATKENDRAA